MCGIAGVIRGQRANDTETLRRQIRTMGDALAHRGPDGQGRYVSQDARVGLEHRRLAILDPEHGHQPMSLDPSGETRITDSNAELQSRLGSLTIVFNGCIYNFAELARELRALGHRLRTHCDTEVILHAYREWGAACVSRFNGMFAFAIWDEASQELFCARDRVGIKPFYFTTGADGSGTFAFASEVKALLASGIVDRAADPDGLRQYLTFQLCLGDRTLFNGVRTLEPGHTLRVRPGEQPRIERYWDLAFNIQPDISEDEWVDKLKFLIEDSTRQRLVSDVPLGSHLSGGLDSSSLVSLVRLALGDSPLKTFTGAFRGEGYDETRYAKAVAEHNRAQYHETYLDEKSFVDSIQSIAWHMDYPEAGPGVFPQYWVSRLASQHVKVVLGGQGGDEVFIGYARYLVAYLEECLRGAINDTADRDQYVATMETIVPQLPTLQQYVPMLRSFWSEGLFEAPANRYFRLMDRSAGAKAIIARPDLLNGERTFAEFSAIFNHHDAASNINRILYFDLKSHLKALLHVEDRTSMAWGLESRVPLLDYRLFELMASCPPVIKFKGGELKHIYKRAIEHLLPEPVLNRKDKMGFPVPLNDWMKGSLGSFVRDLLLDKTARERGLFDAQAIEQQIENQGSFGRGLWGAICLELWHRTFIDGSGVTPRVEPKAPHASVGSEQPQALS